METDSTDRRADLPERLRTALGAAFTVERELGGGGMSRVFLAHDARLGRRVVVKVLHPDLAAGLSARRFEREVTLAARLQHPHVVPLHTSGEVGGLPYYTMPFVQGESLRERLRREGPLPLADAVRLVREMADALAYAHGEGVVHRDLKPENVLLSGGHAMVADFGIAKALATATHGGGADSASGAGAAPETTLVVTGLGMAVGTPAYMAPEQAAGDPATDHRADLYALGLIAYETLTGAHPFAGRSPQAVLAAHLTEAPQPLVARRPDVPPMLDALVTRLLAKRPEDRPQSAQEVMAALDTLAFSATRTPPPALALQRSRARLGAAVLAIALGLGVAGTLVWSRRPAPSARVVAPPSAGVALVERRVAVAPFANQTGDTALAPLGRLACDWIAQGLAEAGYAEVVDPETVRLAWQSAPNGRALAAATRAGIIVSGSYYRDGDTLRLLAQITNAADGKLLLALPPVGAAATSPRQAVAAVRERVLGAIGGLLDVRAATWAATSGLPPSVAAYERWSAGLEHYYRNEMDAAVADFKAATRLDSTFVLPLVWAATVSRPATADSLLQIAVRSRPRLAPADRYLLDMTQAVTRGDWIGALQAAREMARLTPASGVALSVVGWQATRTNRPREAVAALQRLDPQRPPMSQYPAYWDELTLGHHMIGDYAAELTAAQRGRQQHPDRMTTLYDEARALAALGRIGDVSRRLDEAVDLPASPMFATGEVIRGVGVELRAHRQEAAAQGALARALRWWAERPTAERATEAWRVRYAQALYTAGAWEEARRLLEPLAGLPANSKPDSYLGFVDAGPPDALDRRGYLGVIAARRGDRAAALEADRALAATSMPYLRGRHTYWRARIAALLGESDRAVVLLREALQQGRTYQEVHGEADLMPLRDVPAFQELVRPKG